MNKYDGMNKNIVASIRKFAHRLKSILSMELDDIEQELMCRFFMIKGKFDPKKGSFSVFINAILHKVSVDLIREQIRDKRITRLLSVTYNDQKHGISNDFYSDNWTRLIDKLPYKYRLLYQLLRHNSVTEIARKVSLSRTYVHSSLNLLASYLHHCNTLENDGLVLIRSKFKMKNLSVIETSSIKELSELAIYDLADLNDQVAKLLSHAKDLKTKLDDALALRFSETVNANLRQENRDTGTTKFIENGFQITVEVPKKVTWNAEQMEEIIKKIPEDKCKSIVKTTYVIDERRYSQLSYEYKLLFQPARTVTPGKMRFQITLPEGQHDVGSGNF